MELVNGATGESAMLNGAMGESAYYYSALPRALSNARTAASSWASVPARVSPIGRLTSMSTGRGCPSISVLSAALTRMWGKRNVEPSMSCTSHV
jgi:hypothetical protein